MAFKLRSGNKPSFKSMGAKSTNKFRMAVDPRVNMGNRNAMSGNMYDSKAKSTNLKSPNLEEKMYGGDKTFSEAEAQSKGQMNEVIKQQKAYEKKKMEENPDWNKREDNAWKARQNQINEYAGSKKRYEVDSGKQEDGSKVKQNTRGGTGDTASVDKTVVKDGDVKDKDVIKKNEDGEIIQTKNVDKDEDSTQKIVKKFGEEGELVGVRGYATGEGKEEFKDEKSKLKNEAKINKLKAKLKDLDPDSNRYKNIQEKITKLSA
jgi:hypothetical protein